MKNALYFRGDVAIMYDADASLKFSWPEDKTEINWPSDDIALEGETNLGLGSSYAMQGINHVVAIVGWGPCEVKNVSASSRCIHIFMNLLLFHSSLLLSNFNFYSARQT